MSKSTITRQTQTQGTQQAHPKPAQPCDPVPVPTASPQQPVRPWRQVLTLPHRQRKNYFRRSRPAVAVGPEDAGKTTTSTPSPAQGATAAPPDQAPKIKKQPAHQGPSSSTRRRRNMGRPTHPIKSRQRHNRSRDAGQASAPPWTSTRRVSDINSKDYLGPQQPNSPSPLKGSDRTMMLL